MTDGIEYANPDNATSLLKRLWRIGPWLLVVTGINLLSMPAFRYGGDPAAIEFASIQLINSGSISIPAGVARTFGDRGQFYFENTKKGRWYSKYGIANTLIFAIPRIIEKLFTGQISHRSRHRILFLNIFNIFLSLILFSYLFQLSGLYSKKSWIRAAFCLSVFYSTYLWNYLRAQSSEIYQTLFFVGFCYHAILYFRAPVIDGQKTIDKKSRFNLIAALTFLGLICLVKIVYILMIPGFILVLWKELVPQGLKVGQIWKLLNVRRVRWTFSVSLGFIFSLGIMIGVINYYKFGSIFETGYGQWKLEPSFSVTNIIKYFWEALFHPQKSILIHFPIIIFSFLGVKKFLKYHQKEGLLIGLTVIPVFLCIFSYENWTGEWGYGPRYCLFALPVLTLPVIFTIEQLSVWKNRVGASLLSIILFTILTYSTFLQWNVNSLKFNISYEISNISYKISEGVFIKIKDPLMMDYFTKMHFGMINHDLIKFRDERDDLPFLENLYATLDNELINRVENQILIRLQPNYFWMNR